MDTEKLKESSEHWYCPRCGGKEILRERRPNGNAKCENGHTYPMRETVRRPASKPAMSADELLPLPEPDTYWTPGTRAYREVTLTTYATANVAHATAGLRVELERMTALRDGWGAAANEARVHADRYKAERDTARAELAAAREDAARLDWLETTGYPEQFARHEHATPERRWFDNYTLGSDYAPTLRAAIDAAMQERK